MKKVRILFGLLAVCLLITGIVLFAPTKANAISGTDGVYSFSISAGKVTITDVDTSIAGDAIVPATLDGYPVTAIGKNAFDSCDKITSISLPDSVTTIGNEAFRYCSSVTNFSLSKNLITIGNNAFSNCKSLVTIEIPDSVVNLGGWTFNFCENLTSIIIGKSVVLVDSMMFNGCPLLNSIYVSEGNNIYASDESGLLLSADKTELILVPQGKLNVEIPDSITVIGPSSFSGCGWLTVVRIPDNVEIISDYAFMWCGNLVDVEIGKGVTTIGENAFSECARLSQWTGGDNIKTIEDSAFRDCSSLTSIVIPHSVTEIAANTFAGCTALETIYLPKPIKNIGYRAFGHYEKYSNPECISLKEIYYAGSQTDWCDVVVNTEGGGNSYFVNANVTYDYCIHNWNNGEITQAANCIENGVITYTCIGCGETKTESIEKNEAHCFENGVCPLCGSHDPSTTEPEKPLGFFEAIAAFFEQLFRTLFFFLYL